MKFRILLAAALALSGLFTTPSGVAFADEPDVETVSLPSAEAEFSFQDADGYQYTVSYDIQPTAEIDRTQGKPGNVQVTLDFTDSTVSVTNDTPGKVAKGLIAEVYPMYRWNFDEDSDRKPTALLYNHQVTYNDANYWAFRGGNDVQSASDGIRMANVYEFLNQSEDGHMSEAWFSRTARA
jgi:hypothetical protein